MFAALPGRRSYDGLWFVLFVVLVFVGSAVVSLPESDRPAEAISSFYQVHRSAVVITQAVGLAAVVVLLMVLAVLLRWVGGGWPLLISGGLVALASLGTAVPCWCSLSMTGSVRPAPYRPLVGLTGLTTRCSSRSLCSSALSRRGCRRQPCECRASSSPLLAGSAASGLRSASMPSTSSPH